MVDTESPSDSATLERARSLADFQMWSLALQRRRLLADEPEDGEFLFRRLADFDFLIVTLIRLRRAALIAQTVPTAAAEIGRAIAEFDRTLPSLKTMRDAWEHIDNYAVDSNKRHHKKIDRRMLQVAAFTGTHLHWLGAELDTNEAGAAARTLFLAIKRAARKS